MRHAMALPMILLLAVMLAACTDSDRSAGRTVTMTDYGTKMTQGEETMKLTSTAFKHNGKIPQKYTCDGDNISPPLRISDAPEETRTFVLIMDDPDVPAKVRPERMWDHWVVFNIPADTKVIPEDSSPGMKGKGSYPTTDYGGPCPPPQYEPTEHRYFFKLYALDINLPLQEGATKKEVEAAMDGHVLAKAELIGRYSRK